MLNTKAATRYAGALFKSAREGDLIDGVYVALRSLAELLTASPRLLELLKSPVLAPREKERALRDSLGPGAPPLLGNFVALLAAKKRIDVLPAVADAYHRLVNDYRGLIEVEVASAVALQPAEEERLVRALERQTGRKVILRKRLDRGLLGGLAVRYDDTVIEGSARSSLRALHRQLLKVRIPLPARDADRGS